MNAAREINAIRRAGVLAAEGDSRMARRLVRQVATARGQAEAAYIRACIASHLRVLRCQGHGFVQQPTERAHGRR